VKASFVAPNAAEDAFIACDSAQVRTEEEDTTSPVSHPLLMPHVNIKHFPAALSAEQRSALVAEVTGAVQRAFACEERVVSIALEPVEQDAWHESVYVPEIENRKELLHKTPNY
jgi:4-oxalocrotonate tautomerase